MYHLHQNTFASHRPFCASERLDRACHTRIWINGHHIKTQQSSANFAVLPDRKNILYHVHPRTLW